MTYDKQPTRLAPVDAWSEVDAARRERAAIVAAGCRTAVAWLYRGGAPSELSADLPADPTFSPPTGLPARLARWLRSAVSFSGSRPA